MELIVAGVGKMDSKPRSHAVEDLNGCIYPDCSLCQLAPVNMEIIPEQRRSYELISVSIPYLIPSEAPSNMSPLTRRMTSTTVPTSW